MLYRVVDFLPALKAHFLKVSYDEVMLQSHVVCRLPLSRKLPWAMEAWIAIDTLLDRDSSALCHVVVEVFRYPLELFVAFRALESWSFAILFAIEFTERRMNLAMRFQAFS
jgi:hypothetical protein